MAGEEEPTSLPRPLELQSAASGPMPSTTAASGSTVSELYRPMCLPAQGHARPGKIGKTGRKRGKMALPVTLWLIWMRCRIGSFGLGASALRQKWDMPPVQCGITG